MSRWFQAVLAAVLLLAGIAHAHVATDGVERVDGVAALAADAMASVDAGQFEAATFTTADGAVLPYRLLRPSHLQPGRRYPLVLQLHGSGGIGTDNRAQLDRLARSWAMPSVRERYQAFVLVPQFAIRSANYGPATADQLAQASPALADGLALVRDFAAHHPVDGSRIYATGFSMGGSAAWLAPTLDPSLLAAIVPISGVAPGDASAVAMRRLPVLILHGEADPENPIVADQRFFQALRRAGNPDVRLRQYRGLDHQPPADIQPGTWWRDWLFAQRRR